MKTIFFFYNKKEIKIKIEKKSNTFQLRNEAPKEE